MRNMFTALCLGLDVSTTVILKMFLQAENKTRSDMIHVVHCLVDENVTRCDGFYLYTIFLLAG